MSGASLDALVLSADAEASIERDIAAAFPPVARATGAARVVLVDGMPTTTKADKLGKVVRVKFAEHGKVCAFDLDVQAGETTGFGFVTFEDERTAQTAAKRMNNVKLDKTHSFKTLVLADLPALDALPAELADDGADDVQVPENLAAWLEDERAIDQYVIRYGDRTEVYWNEQKGASKAALVHGRDNWTETFVRWSPRGSYLVTMHRQGVALWGGPSWKRLIRFQHPKAEVAEFSPRENYLVTFSPQFVDNDDPADPRAIAVWDVRTGRKLRGFMNGQTPFLWSYDDRFVARLDVDKVSVYETPSMGLHQKQSLKVTGVSEFAWAPAGAPVLAYFVPALGAAAARVVLVEFPSRKVLRTKNLFNVTGAKLVWHPDGTFLAVKVDRQKKKTKFTNFEIFSTQNLRKKKPDVAVDVLERTDAQHGFAWEPNGSRFGIVHGEGPRHEISFYEAGGRKLVHLVTLEKKPANTIVWSPCGRYCVLAGLRQLNGQLEFYDAEGQQSLGSDEHFMCSTVEWDPSGQFVTTAVSAWRQKLETGFNLFNFQGQKVHSLLRDQFFMHAWRPRPPSLVTAAKMREIDENLDAYIESISAADKVRQKRVASEDKNKRAQQTSAFAAQVADARQRYEAERDARIAVYGFDPDAPLSDDALVVVDGTEEKLLDEKIEILDEVMPGEGR